MRRGILRTASASPRPRPYRRVKWADIPVDERPWGEVPDNVVVTIAGFLCCRADRVHMSFVNKNWRAAMMLLQRPPPPWLPAPRPLPPQLPWLLFPSTEAPTFYTALTRRYHRLGRVPPDVRRARCCGSGDGGWLVLALDSRHAHALYNLFSGARIPLPPGFTSPSDIELPLVVRAATLSAAPTPPNPYMVAAIVLVATRSTAAFWSEGSESWFTSGAFLKVRPQDVLFYGGAFYFLTSREGVVSFRPGYGPNGNVSMERVDYQMLPRRDYFDDVEFIRGMGTIRHYLVESRGRLLMVVRFVYNDMGTGLLRVFGFRVMASVTNDGRPPRAAWEDLGADGLDGRMLFLGPGCSRSFEVAQYDGFQDEESSMFFLDERFASVPVADGRRLYTFADTGRYNEDDMNTDPWPQGRCPLRSDNAPPTWWLH